MVKFQVACLVDPEGIRHEEEISVAIVTAVLEDMNTDLLLCRKSWERYGRTWCMLRQGKEERSHMEY